MYAAVYTVAADVCASDMQATSKWSPDRTSPVLTLNICIFGRDTVIVESMQLVRVGVQNFQIKINVHNKTVKERNVH